MPPRLNLDDLRPHITEMVKSHTHNEILAWLEGQNVIVSQRTLSRRLQEWEVGSHTITSSRGDSPAYQYLVARVEDLYHHQRSLSDNQIAWILRSEEGLLVSPRQVRQIRCRCRWMRRHDAEVDALAQAQETQDLIQNLLAEGTIRQYGMRLLTTHLAVKYGHRARSDHVRAAIHILDQNGLASRGRVGQRKPRKNYVVPGPDWLWCLDGHDKLSRYGIAIYGCVDAYSRNIIWFYVGSSNRTAVSVVCQYLEAVGLRDKCPNYLRTDDGTEISMMADAQYFLYWADQVKEYEAGRRTAEDLAGVTVRDCFITGKSTANIRIEGLWGQLIRGQTESWMEYFALLSRNLFFRDDCATDKVVLTFIFMPIISREITDWVRVHNANRIRSQRNRPTTVSGVPHTLYHYPNPDTPSWGFPLDRDTHRDLTSLVQGYDLHEYLEPDTMRCCEAYLQRVGISTPLIFIEHASGVDVPASYTRSTLPLWMRTRDLQRNERERVKQYTRHSRPIRSPRLTSRGGDVLSRRPSQGRRERMALLPEEAHASGGHQIASIPQCDPMRTMRTVSSIRMYPFA